MKIIINESQLRLIIENEEREDKEDILYDFTPHYKEYKPEKWDKIFSLIKKGEKINYRGYYINDNVKIESSKATELSYLVMVGGELYLSRTTINSLPMLDSVGGDVNLFITNVESFPKLRSVGGKFNLYKTPLSSLPELISVGKDLLLDQIQIESLPKLKRVGGVLNLVSTIIKNLPMLEHVGKDLFLNNSMIKSLPNLKSVGANLHLENTPLGVELKDATSEDRENQLNNFGVKRKIYL